MMLDEPTVWAMPYLNALCCQMVTDKYIVVERKMFVKGFQFYPSNF